MRSTLMALTAALALSGCALRGPAPAARPQVPLGSWVELEVRSPETGVSYRYLHHPGPSPTSAAMLLLPGGIFDNRIWLYSDDLAHHFALYALDWPDQSPLYDGRVEALGASAADFARSMDLGGFHLAGVSAGGFAAVDLASRFPELEPLSLTLISTLTFSITREEVRKRSRMGRLAGRLPDPLLAGIIQRRALSTPYDPAPGEVQQPDIFWVRAASYYDQIFGISVAQGSRRQATEAVGVPVLVLHGTDDEIMPIDTARLTPGAYADATMIELPGYGHAMLFSHGPELAEHMLEHLASHALLPGLED